MTCSLSVAGSSGSSTSMLQCGEYFVEKDSLFTVALVDGDGLLLKGVQAVLANNSFTLPSEIVRSAHNVAGQFLRGSKATRIKPV